MCGGFDLESKDGEDEGGKQAVSKLAQEAQSVVKTASGEDVPLSSLVAVSVGAGVGAGLYCEHKE